MLETTTQTTTQTFYEVHGDHGGVMCETFKTKEQAQNAIKKRNKEERKQSYIETIYFVMLCITNYTIIKDINNNIISSIEAITKTRV